MNQEIKDENRGLLDDLLRPKNEGNSRDINECKSLSSYSTDGKGDTSISKKRLSVSSATIATPSHESLEGSTGTAESASLTLSVANTSQCHPVALAMIDTDTESEHRSVPAKLKPSAQLTAKKRTASLYPAWTQMAKQWRQDEVERKTKEAKELPVKTEDKTGKSTNTEAPDAGI